VPSPAAQTEKTDPAEQRPVSQEYEQLFRAAGVLVFAAMSWEMPILEKVRKRFIEAGDDAQTQDQLRTDFREAFDSLFVARIVDGTLVLWQKELYCLAYTHPETGLVEKVGVPFTIYNSPDAHSHGGKMMRRTRMRGRAALATPSATEQLTRNEQVSGLSRLWRLCWAGVAARRSVYANIPGSSTRTTSARSNGIPAFRACSMMASTLGAWYSQ
jgi:hypothetical protein